MSRHEDIDNAIWTDPDFEELSADATLLYLWSFTNPRCGMAGLYKCSRRGLTDSKLDGERLDAALSELDAAQFMFYEQNVVWVRSRVKHLRAKSPRMAQSIASDVLKVPADHALRRRFETEYGAAAWLRDALSPTVLDTSPDHPETVSENLVNREKSHTVPGPSLDGPLTGTGTGTGTGSSSERAGRVELPDDFPRELTPHLRAVFRVLRDLARRHHAKAVQPRSLAAVVMARRHKPLVRAAYDCAAHWDGGERHVKDVVAAYRNWLDRTDDLAGVEPLDAAGRPAAGHTRGGDGRENASAILRDLWRDAGPVIIDADVVSEEAA